MTQITGARFDPTVLRYRGRGDNWHLTWNADDSQFAALCDGSGFAGTPRAEYNSALYRIVGDPPELTFERVDGYPHLITTAESPNHARYYGFGTLAVDGTVYQYLDTFNRTIDLDGTGLQFCGAKLVYSPDGGHTWHNQDGSTPVRYEGWDERSRSTLVFYEEPQQSFALHSILQMGRDYSLNTDGYVYVYSPNGVVDGSMNELVMFRVPKQRVLDRSAYEYFAGLGSDGSASWDGDITRRQPTITFPTGWVNELLHPYAWQPTVTYNEALDCYLMAAWAPGVAADGWWFGSASYLGLYSAPNPWGPWTQFFENRSWTPDDDAAARCYSPVIAPKWIAADGKSFWLLFTDFQSAVERDDRIERTLRWRAAVDAGEMTEDEQHTELESLSPYYSVNLQRVELLVDTD